MRYIDSGSREPSQALGTWLNAELDGDVTELRIQSGFYSREAIAAFRILTHTETLIRIVVGSNDGGTIKSHLDELVEAMGLPRTNASLGLVYYTGAYYHPKTYHFRKKDGSQLAYVGSANMTLSGIAARHVEAGVIFDTREGDSPDFLLAIADATDSWFKTARPGFEPIKDSDDVERLFEEGLIRATAPARPGRPLSSKGSPPKRPSLAPLVVFEAPPQPAAIPIPEALWEPSPTIQRTPPYPPYMFFASDAEGPVKGLEALTATGLGASRGLIIRLSRDNDRHWREAPGTANISIPVSTAATLRFGVYGDRQRPRAEFDLRIRYINANVTLEATPNVTAIMSFGFTPNDTGHGDLRMLLPRQPIAELLRQLKDRDAVIPKAQDMALLEWPTPDEPLFRMTFTDPASELGVQLQNVWTNSAANGELASRGACWLPPDVSPVW